MTDSKAQGIKFIIYSGLFFGITNILVKYLSHIAPIEIVFFRSLISLILSFVMIKKLRLNFPKEGLHLLVLRGVFGALGLILFFTSIQRIPLAAAVTLLYLAPVFTFIFSIFINKENPHPKQWPFLLLAFAGAALMKSASLDINNLDLLIAISGAMFAGLAYNIIRKLKDIAHHQVIILFFPLVTIPIITPFLPLVWKTPNAVELVLLIAVGIFTQLAQIFLTRGYMQAPVTQIGHFSYLTSIYAVIAGYFLFNETLDLQAILGMITIIIGVYFCSRFTS